MIVHSACDILLFYLLYVNGNAQNVCFLLLNITQYARPKNGGTKVKKGWYAVRKGEGGVTLHHRQFQIN